MSAQEPNVAATQKLVDDIENFGNSKWKPYGYTLASWIGFFFSLGSLVYGYFAGSLLSIEVRSLHLGFVLILSLLLYPCKKSLRTSKTAFWLDMLFVIGAGVSCFYLFYIAPELSKHIGSLKLTDKILGVIFIICLLEGTRRVIGLAVPLLGLAFFAYNFIGPYLVGMFRHRGFSLSRVISHIYMTTEGAFSSPLGAAADYIVLFTVFGALLDASGGSKFFTDMALCFCGRRRGGPGKVAVMASGLFGCISGSAAANVLVTGQVTIPMMKKYGFTSKFAGAITACASSGGQIMPPVMGAAAFIMADMVKGTYLGVCAAAAIPAVLYYFSLFMAVDVESVRQGLHKNTVDSELPSIRQVLTGGWHFVIPLTILIVCLAVIKFSAQRSVLYAIVSLLVILQSRKSTRLSRAQLFAAFRDGAFQAAQVSLACATAGIIIGTFSLTGLGLKLSSILVALANGKLLILLALTMVASLILGMGMPTTAAYVVLAILVAPALVKFGVAPIAAHMFVFYFGVISAITPPVALAAFSAASLTGDNPVDVGWAACRFGIVSFIIPFMFIYSPGMVLQGSVMQIIMGTALAVVGVMAIVYGSVGYIFRKLNPLFRLLLIASGICMITDELVSTIAGIAVFVLIVVIEYLTTKRKSA